MSRAICVWQSHVQKKTAETKHQTQNQFAQQVQEQVQLQMLAFFESQNGRHFYTAMKELFRVADVDGDGFLTREDYAALCVSNSLPDLWGGESALVSNVVEAASGSGDSLPSSPDQGPEHVLISMRQFMRGLGLESHLDADYCTVKEEFRSTDTNDNGVITREEHLELNRTKEVDVTLLGVQSSMQHQLIRLGADKQDSVSIAKYMEAKGLLSCPREDLEFNEFTDCYSKGTKGTPTEDVASVRGQRYYGDNSDDGSDDDEGGDGEVPIL